MAQVQTLGAQLQDQLIPALERLGQAILQSTAPVAQASSALQIFALHDRAGLEEYLAGVNFAEEPDRHVNCRCEIAQKPVADPWARFAMLELD